MALILLPQPHSSCSHTAILKNRRLLEDKVVAMLGSNQILLFVLAYLSLCMGLPLDACAY